VEGGMVEWEKVEEEVEGRRWRGGGGGGEEVEGKRWRGGGGGGEKVEGEVEGKDKEEPYLIR